MNQGNNALTQAAMKYGTQLGLLWIAIFAIYIKALTTPDMSLIFLILLIASPIFAGYLGVKYRKKECGNKLNFISSWALMIIIYLCAALLAAIACYVYFQYIDNGLALSAFKEQIDAYQTMEIDENMKQAFTDTYDILANNVLISSERKDSILFTHPILLSRQILVQRKPQEKNDSTHIKSLLELANKTVHVVKGSPSILRIQHLSNEIGDTIFIQEVEKYGQEQLLAMVANNDIDYAICDENIALTSAHHLPVLDIETAISFTQFYSWGVHKDNTVLLDSLNSWLQNFKQTETFHELLKKYTLN